MKTSIHRFGALLLALLTTGLFAQENDAYFGTRQACSHCRRAITTGWGMARPAAANAVADAYDVHFYHIDIAAENTTTQISGNLKASSTVILTAMDTFWFELNTAISIDSVLVNGAKRSFSRLGQLVRVPLPAALPVGAALETQVFYQGDPTNANDYADGISSRQSGSWKVFATWTLSEPFGAPDWLPIKQDLRDKIDSVRLYVTTTPPNKAGGNGLLTGVTPMPGGKMRYEWTTRIPIDFYLIAFSVAPYVERTYNIKLNGQTDSMLFQNFIYKAKNSAGDSCEAFFAADIDETPDMLAVFSDKYSIYPFYAEKYGHMMAPFSGGMEHQTMTTQGFFNRDLTAHELGHQWFGDNVTCATWQDIWLNEGFASYSEYVYNQSISAADAASWLSGTQSSVVQNGTSGSVYVPVGATSSRIFSSTLTYDKGACVVHMLRYLLGDSAFFASLQAYQQAFGSSTATTDDFRSFMELQSGVPLADFANEWIYGEGYPRYTAKWNQTGNYVYVVVDQTPSNGAVTPYFSVPVPVVLTIGGQKQELRVVPDGNVQWFEVKGTATAAALDPDKWLLKGTSTLTKDGTLTGVEAPAAIQVKVWPNPATNGVLRISANGSDAAHFRLYDATGRLVRATGIGTGVVLEGIPAGIYYWVADAATASMASGTVVVE